MRGAGEISEELSLPAKDLFVRGDSRSEGLVERGMTSKRC
jgi:hypothetical protein